MKQSEAIVPALSVSSLLKGIYDENRSMNKILGDIDKTLKSVITGGKMSFTTNNQTLNSYSNNNVNNTNFNFDNLSDAIVNGMSNTINSTFLTQNLMEVFERIYSVLLTILIRIGDVIDNIRDIYLYLPNINSDRGENENKARSSKNEFINLIKSIGTLKRTLNKKMLDMFESFVLIYERFISSDNTKKLMAVSVGLNGFAFTLNILAALLGNVKDLFNGITLSIMMLTLVLILPPFQIGFAYLITMIGLFKKTMGGTQESFEFTVSLRSLGLSILMLSGALYFMGTIDFANVFKLVLFLTALGGVLRLFQKKNNNPIITPNVNVKKTFGVTGIFSAAVGIAILVLSLDLAANVDYGKAGGIILFIFGLATTLWIFNRNKIGKSGPLDSLMNMSLGLSILILVLDSVGEISWSAAAMIIGFIISLGGAIALANRLMGNSSKGGKSFKLGLSANVGMSGIFGFAAGMAILILAVDAANDVNWSKAWIVITFIAAVTLTLKIFSGNTKTNGMISFAIGMGILILAVDVANGINFAGGWNLLLFMSGVVGVMFLMKHLIGGPKLMSLQMIAFSTAITLVAGALFLVQKLNVDLNKIVIFVTGVMLFVGLFYILGKLKSHIMKAMFITHILAFAIAGISAGMVILSKTNVTTKQIIMFVSATLAMIGMTYLISKISGPILKGSGVLIIMGIATNLFAEALVKITNTNVNFVQIGMLIAVTATMAAMAFGLSFIALPISVGSGVLILLGFAILTIAYGLKKIAEMSIDRESINMFINSLKDIAWGFAKLTPILIIAIPAAILGGVLGLSATIFAGALSIIAEMTYNKESIDGFIYGIKGIAEGYNSIGLVDLTLAVAKSVLLLPIGAAALIFIAVLKGIEAMNVSSNSMKNFGTTLNDFLYYTTEAINNSMDSMKKVEPGLKALSKLVSVGSSLINIVDSYANMKIGIWEYDKETGQMKLVNYKQIGQTELAAVGIGIGKLIKSLIDPLSVISSDDEYWVFGGDRIKNPFVGGFFGDNNKGVKRIEKIGNAFNGLTAFFNSIAPISSLDGSAATNAIANVLNELSDEAKWNMINKNLETTGKNMKEIVSNINTLDISKAVALERNLKMFAETNNIEGIKECIKHLKELIDLMKKDSNNQTTTIVEKSSNVNKQPTIVNTTEIDNTPMFKSLQDTLTSISEKLEDSINVKIIESGGLSV